MSVHTVCAGSLTHLPGGSQKTHHWGCFVFVLLFRGPGNTHCQYARWNRCKHLLRDCLKYSLKRSLQAKGTSCFGKWLWKQGTWGNLWSQGTSGDLIRQRSFQKPMRKSMISCHSVERGACWKDFTGVRNKSTVRTMWTVSSVNETDLGGDPWIYFKHSTYKAHLFLSRFSLFTLPLLPLQGKKR